MEVRAVEDTVELLPIRDDGANNAILRSTVNLGPFCSRQAKFRSYPLSQLQSAEQRRVQESLVVRDLLDTLMGLEGMYIRYNNSYDPAVDAMPSFRISKNMDPSFKQYCIKLLKLGKSYIFLNNCTQEWSRPSYGCVLHRLSYEIRMFVKDSYLRFIVDRLEKEYNSNPSFSIRDMEHLINEYELNKKMELLYNLCVRITDETNSRLNMNLDQEDFNNFKKELEDVGQAILLPTDSSLSLTPKGGNIIKYIQEMISHSLGDRNNVAFLKALLNKVGEDYLLMLKEWLINGDIKDRHEEFMIRDMMKDVIIEDNMMTTDRLWETRYLIRKDGLLDKFSDDLLYKLLMTGKLLNIVKVCTEVTSIPRDKRAMRDEEKQLKFVDLMEGTNLELYVTRWYDRANDLCMNLFLHGYDLQNFVLDILKTYLHYKNGNKFQYFVESNRHELGKKYVGSVTILRRLEQVWESRVVEDRSLVDRLVTLKYSPMNLRDSVLQFVDGHGLGLSGGSGGGGDDDEDMMLMDEDVMQASNFENVKRILFAEDGREVDKDVDNDSLYSNIYHLELDVVIPYPLNVVINHSCMIQLKIFNRYLNLLKYVGAQLAETQKAAAAPAFAAAATAGGTHSKDTSIIIYKLIQLVNVLTVAFTRDVVTPELAALSTTTTTTATTTTLRLPQIQSALQDTLTNIMSSTLLSCQCITIQLDMFRVIDSYARAVCARARAHTRSGHGHGHGHTRTNQSPASFHKLTRYNSEVKATMQALCHAMLDAVLSSSATLSSAATTSSATSASVPHSLAVHLSGISFV